MATEILVNIGPGNGLFPDGTKALPWTNLDVSSVRVSGIHLRAISQEIPQLRITEISFKIIYIKFHSSIPGANGLIHVSKGAPGNVAQWLFAWLLKNYIVYKLFDDNIYIGYKLVFISLFAIPGCQKGKLNHCGLVTPYGSTLAQVSHYLNQCWLIMSEVQWHSY